MRPSRKRVCLVQHAGVAGGPHVAARSPAAATGSRRSRPCARRDPAADATSAARRLRGTGVPHRVSSCCADEFAAPHAAAPSNPAAGRGSRTRRRTGSSRCVPTGGRRWSGTAASRWPARPAPRRACSTCTAAQGLLPVLAHLLQCVVRGGPLPRNALHQFAPLRRRCGPAPRRNTTSRSSPPSSVNRHLQRGARIQPRADAGRTDCARAACGGVAQAAVAAEEFGAVAARCSCGSRHVEERHPLGELGVVGVAWRTAPRLIAIRFGDDVHRGLFAQVAQHPFDVAGGGRRRVAPDSLRTFSDRELHRGIECHVDPQLRRDAVLGVLEHAVAEAVAGHVGRAAARGNGVGDQKWPVSSSRRYNASPLDSPTGSLCHGVRRNCARSRPRCRRCRSPT